MELTVLRWRVYSEDLPLQPALCQWCIFFKERHFPFMLFQVSLPTLLFTPACPRTRHLCAFWLQFHCPQQCNLHVRCNWTLLALCPCFGHIIGRISIMPQDVTPNGHLWSNTGLCVVSSITLIAILFTNYTYKIAGPVLVCWIKDSCRSYIY